MNLCYNEVTKGWAYLNYRNLRNVFFKIPCILCLFVCVACSGFRTVSRIHDSGEGVKIFGKKIFLSAKVCNVSRCENTNGEIYTGLVETIQNDLKSRGAHIVDNKSEAQYEYVLVSTFEGDIQEEMPRNFYLIGFHIKGNKEIFQVALSRPFESPLTARYDSMMDVEVTLTQLLDSVIGGRELASLP